MLYFSYITSAFVSCFTFPLSPPVWPPTVLVLKDVWVEHDSQLHTSYRTNRKRGKKTAKVEYYTRGSCRMAAHVFIAWRHDCGGLTGLQHPSNHTRSNFPTLASRTLSVMWFAAGQIFSNTQKSDQGLHNVTVIPAAVPRQFTPGCVIWL